MSNDAMREAFERAYEKAAIEAGNESTPFTRNESGDYLNMYAQAAWWGYQAALAAPAQTRIAELESALKQYAEGPGCSVAIAALSKSAPAQNDDRFKSFHRPLCERFGYVHDDADWKRDLLSLEEHIASRIAPAQSGDEIPVEVWHGDRKVTIYKNSVLRSWGVNIETEMSDEPRSLDSVQSALNWLYSAPAQSEAKPVYPVYQTNCGDDGWEDVDIAEYEEWVYKKRIVYLAPPSAAPAQPVKNRDDIERAIAFHQLEMLANGPVVAMQKTLSEFSAARAQSVAWTARWHGSNPERGWSIYAGRDCIAYIGGDGGMSEAISEIVAAHNKCFDCDGGPCVMNCSGRASRISDATKGGEANPDAHSEAKPFCYIRDSDVEALPMSSTLLTHIHDFESIGADVPLYRNPPSAAPVGDGGDSEEGPDKARIQALMLQWINSAPGQDAKAVWDQIDVLLTARHAPAGAAAELPEEWLPINDAPWTDDLIWVRKGDSIDGPKRIDNDDYDKYTHYAPCEPPAILPKRGAAS